MNVTITSRYNAIDSVHSTPHTGIDLLMNEGTPLRTFRDGVVTKVLDLGDKNVGKGVVIKYDDGTYGIYGHLSEIQTRVGAVLHKGDQFALSGNTGNSTGAHLHFGLKDASGNFIDPSPFARDVAQYAGDVGIMEKIATFNIWEWAYGKVSEVTGDVAADFMSHIIVAFPVVAVVSAGVYALLNMFSKNVAKWGALVAAIYGFIITK